MWRLPCATALSLAVLWFALYVSFSVARVHCIPAMSAECLRKDWEGFGDLILLHSVERWQTLIAGTLAIAAAFIGGLFINRQIRQTERIERQRLERRHAALRAMMPLALSDLMGYCYAAAAQLRAIYSGSRDGIIPDGNINPRFPSVPAEPLILFRDLIEVSDSNFCHLLAKLLAKIQLQSSRVRGLENAEFQTRPSMHLSSTIEQYIIDTATLYAYAAVLFEYARAETNSVPSFVEWASVHSALNNLGFWQPDDTALHDLLIHREKQGRMP